MATSAYVLYCEDIREEPDNQYSMIGCFKGHVTVTQFPVMMPRLGALIAWTQTKDEALLPVRIRVLFRDQDTDEVHDIFEKTFEFDQMDPEATVGPLLVAEAHVRVVGYLVAKPGTFGARIYRGDEEIRLRGLPFVLHDATLATSS